MLTIFSNLGVYFYNIVSKDNLSPIRIRPSSFVHTSRQRLDLNLIFALRLLVSLKDLRQSTSFSTKSDAMSTENTLVFVKFGMGSEHQLFALEQGCNALPSQAAPR